MVAMVMLGWLPWGGCHGDGVVAMVMPIQL